MLAARGQEARPAQERPASPARRRHFAVPPTASRDSHPTPRYHRSVGASRPVGGPPVYLPRPLYEVLPYAYVLGGGALAVASYLLPSSPWADAALALGSVALVAGIVLILRRRTFRDEASRYDPKSLDDF